MSVTPDGRREAELRHELLRRAAAVFGTNADAIEPGEVIDAILGVAARLGEEVTRRIDRVSDKQAANLYAAMGIGRSPAEPARMHVSLALSDSADEGMLAPEGTKLAASTDKESIIFETAFGISLQRGKVAALAGVDVATDAIFLAPAASLVPALPWRESIRRVLTSGAVAGETSLQVDPATGLAPDMVLRIGESGIEADHMVVKVEEDLVTIEPGLDTTMPAGTEVREVLRFHPFSAGTRNRQAHELYLGHSTLLDVPSETRIVVSGVTGVPGGVEWSWFGKAEGEDEPGWHPIADARLDELGRWVLKKPKGKPAETKVRGKDGLWLRARLDGPSGGVTSVRDIKLKVGGDCPEPGGATCEVEGEGVEYQAVAVNTPVVPSNPFEPFGTEPRLYDSFYVGCEEVFGKAGAEARLCFTMGGATLGPMACVGAGPVDLVFGVGTDGKLYRATLGIEPPRFEEIRAPADLAAGFPLQAPVAAGSRDGWIWLAVGCKGCVYLTKLTANADASAAREWQLLSSDPGSAGVAVSSLQVVLDAERTLLAQFDDLDATGANAKPSRVLKWEAAVADPSAELLDKAFALVPVQGSAGLAALTIADGASGKVELTPYWNDKIPKPNIWPPGPASWIADAANLPARGRAAFAIVDGGDVTVFVGGYDAAVPGEVVSDLRALKLTDIDETVEDVEKLANLPITFEQPYDNHDWPTVVVATPKVTRRALRDGGWVPVGAEEDIGGSANAFRQIVPLSGFTVIQHPDQGLNFRRTTDGVRSLGGKRLDGNFRVVVEDKSIIGSAAYLLLDGADNGEGFELRKASGSSARMLVPLASTVVLEPDPADLNWSESASPLVEKTSSFKDVTITSGQAKLVDDPFGTDTTCFVLVEKEASGKTNPSIWQLSRSSGTADWNLPSGFPVPGSATQRYKGLESQAAQGGDDTVTLDHDNMQTGVGASATAVAAVFGSEPSLTSLFGGGDGSISAAKADFKTFGSESFHVFKSPILKRGPNGEASVWFQVPPEAWLPLGPNQPANPDLSWEYWNGSSWWTLELHGLRDTTADLLGSGGVFFTVPDDLEANEVNGSENRWIRARLVGGDYGRPRITTTSSTKNGVTTSEVTQDASAVRAPHVVSLKIGYCANTPLAPEQVLTNDNLEVLDQTSANLAGLPVRLFSPVATLFAPAPDSDADAEDDGCCEDFPEDNVALVGEGVAEDDDSCEHFFPPSEGESAGDDADGANSPAATMAQPPFSRAIMIGLDQPPQGDVVSLFVDAEPGTDSVELTAKVPRGGRFEEVEILADTSGGLSEPGTIRLNLDEPFDRASYFGRSAFWIVLGLPEAGEGWAPRLRGVYLNGVLAESFETRQNEPVGSSSGAPDQEFGLVEAPVDPASVELFVSEKLGDHEFEQLGAVKEIEGRPGPWVRWTLVGEFPAEDGEKPRRLFTLNAETGVIRFGDGRNALVPPMGAALLARKYRAVTGNAANGIAAGAIVQSLAPIAGIDQVVALEPARGGVDVEPIEQALARAPAKLRVDNDSRLMTLTDIEEFVLARHALVAQARAANKAGKIRLVVAEKGEDVVPLPSARDAIHDSIAAAACFAIAADGRLEVVGPRLLPIMVIVSIEPDPGVDMSGLIAASRSAILALLDHETGGLDGRGWPIGAVPGADDIAAALGDLTLGCTVYGFTLARKGGEPLPDPLPADVLLHLAKDDITVEPVVEAIT